jgi:hypothetical protein
MNTQMLEEILQHPRPRQGDEEVRVVVISRTTTSDSRRG